MNQYHKQASKSVPMAPPQQDAGAPAMNDYEIQIRTAKQFPRNIGGAIEQAKQLCTMTPEVAQDCVYSLPRGGETLTGASVRFAEILLSVWGNSRAITRVTHMDHEYIYASADFVDLELNNAIRIERRRRIVNKNGNLFNSDMIQTTGNAASSIALRQAILQGIPSGYWQTVYDYVQQSLMGDIKTLSQTRQKVLQALSKYAVTAELVCSYLNVESVDQITQQHITALYGIGNALKAGDTTAEILAQESGYTMPTGTGAGVVDNAPPPPQTAQPSPAHQAVVNAVKEIFTAPADTSAGDAYFAEADEKERQAAALKAKQAQQQEQSPAPEVPANAQEIEI